MLRNLIVSTSFGDTILEWIEVAALAIEILAVVIIEMTYFFFLSGDAIEKKLGQSEMKALTRIMGLILTSIGVVIFLGGLSDALNTSIILTIPGSLSGGS